MQKVTRPSSFPSVRLSVPPSVPGRQDAEDKIAVGLTGVGVGAVTEKASRNREQVVSVLNSDVGAHFVMYVF